MRIKSRQNPLYAFINGKNKITTVFIIIWSCYSYLILSLCKLEYIWTFGQSYILHFIMFLLSCIILITTLIFMISYNFYYPRFNPYVYYTYKKSKNNNNSKLYTPLHNTIIATKKYIDRHYSHNRNADELLERSVKLISHKNIITQLPSDYIIGIVTGIVTGLIAGINSDNGDVLSYFIQCGANMIIACVVTVFSIYFLYFSLKTLYSDYNYENIIIPYEIKIIKEKLSKIDDIYCNIE